LFMERRSWDNEIREETEASTLTPDQHAGKNPESA